MFSFLDAINSWLSYINIETKTKARIYVVLGFIGELYMAYISIRFIANGNHLWGLTLLAITIILAYFLYLNIIYYFTTKSSRFDITPMIYKVLHIKPKMEATPGTKMQYQDIPANGLYDARKTMPATIESTDDEQWNINELAQAMLQDHLLKNDYNGLDERTLRKSIKYSQKRFYAIGKGMMVPYFSMKFNDGDYLIYAGINEAEAKLIGKLKTVGLQSIDKIDSQKIKLYLASVYITGGHYKEMGRKEIIDKDENYHIELRIAYKKNAS